MCGYTKELMMAIVVGGTAFIGLAPVLVGQVTKSGLKRCFKEVSYLLLGISVICGMVAITLAAGWLLGPETRVVIPVLVLFGAEIVICEVVMLVICFLLGPFGELEPSKPAAGSKRPRKRALVQ